ncbi:MAG: sugar ABC transporter permease [Chloroflexi bacterium]|jgi:ABC-type sugar transport system permease subunit|nr:MAG: sugar ABC transporter permease [Chloroflexota bacterium]
MDLVNQSKLWSKIKPAKPTRLQQEARIGLLFLAPWLIGFVLLKALPILAALVFSLTDFKMLTPEATKFVGLENYLRFFSDSQAGASLFGSLGYFLVTVPLEMTVALALAAIFTNARLKNKRISQTLIFMTSIIPSTSIFFIFLGSLAYADRLFFKPYNLPPIEGFGLLLPFMALWSIGPGFLIMYSAMESVPNEVYEAARVDGAGPWARLVYITLPMISPAIFFTLVINLTGAFGGSLLLDRGYILSFSLSPMESYINTTMFNRAQLGYASALAWITFAVMMTITVLLFRSARRWVYFPEEDEENEV